jgi:hypothetical protein
MPLNVPDNYVEQFNANTFMLAQQKGSRLLAACERETLQGEVGFVDWTGQVELQERLALYEDTKFTPVPLGRRRYVGRDYEGSDIIDDVSKVRMIADPASRLTRAFAAGQGRKIDDVIIEEFFAPAWAGKQGTVQVNFTAANVIAGDFVETGSATHASLTVAKLRRAKLRLDKAEAGTEPDEQRYLACTADEIANLLRTTEVTSADFAEVKALVEGRINRFMGFDFIRSERLPLVDPTAAHSNANPRRCMAWVKSGMVAVLPMEGNTMAMPDPTKSGNPRLISKLKVGAARMEEAKCVEIRCAPIQ